jgi:hypothetical protein
MMIIPDSHRDLAEKAGTAVLTNEVRRLTPPGAHRFCIAVHPVKANTFG